MSRLRILLADDHETVREGLKAILNAQADMQVIAEAADGQDAVAKAAALLPDIVVIDVSMPLLNGLRATQVMQQRCPQVRVIALTRHSDDGYLQELLRAGARGYVLKQSRASEIVHAIRAVAAGGRYLDPAITGRVIDEAARRRAFPQPRSMEAVLSPREEEVLRLLAWGYSNKEIATQLDLSVKTVETHKINASHKLGVHTRNDIVRFALLKGWLQDT